MSGRCGRSRRRSVDDETYRGDQNPPGTGSTVVDLGDLGNGGDDQWLVGMGVRSGDIREKVGDMGELGDDEKRKDEPRYVVSMFLTQGEGMVMLEDVDMSEYGFEWLLEIFMGYLPGNRTFTLNLLKDKGHIEVVSQDPERPYVLEARKKD